MPESLKYLAFSFILKNPWTKRPTPTIPTSSARPSTCKLGVFEDGIKHKEIVDKIREASETYGFFQIVNHGVEASVLAEMINGVRRFFEQDAEVKKKWYTREPGNLVTYNSNHELFASPAAIWRDSIIFGLVPESPKPEAIPDVCR
jgi:hypothetical protein